VEVATENTKIILARKLRSADTRTDTDTQMAKHLTTVTQSHIKASTFLSKRSTGIIVGSSSLSDDVLSSSLSLSQSECFRYN